MSWSEEYSNVIYVKLGKPSSWFKSLGSILQSDELKMGLLRRIYFKFLELESFFSLKPSRKNM